MNSKTIFTGFAALTLTIAAGLGARGQSAPVAGDRLSGTFAAIRQRRALLASGVPVFMMPLDSTQIRLTQPELAAVFSQGSPLTDQLTLLYHQWAGAGAWKMPTLYDPVAAAYAIHPEICPAQPMHLDVDEKGFTRPGPGTPNVQVCLNADEKGFRAFLLQRILRAPTQ